MTRNAKIVLGVLGVLAAIAVTLGILVGGGRDNQPRADGTTSTSPATTTASSAAEPIERGAASANTKNARILGSPGDSGVRFTEFLDFECEACGAAYPAIEALRKEYAGRVTFSIRYFPIPSHPNAMNAASAVEAAAQQNALEPMYRQMYETQKQWSHQQSSKAALFRTWAQELGLDLAQYDAAVASAATRRRIRSDVRRGTSLGVGGTPTFFLDEKMIRPQTLDDLRRRLDAAIATR
jgi:protein-disulfide isomerase